MIASAVRPPRFRPPQRIAHWTPRYVVNRARLMAYERWHADHPWLTPSAIRLLESMLRPEDHGVEFGSGRSTVWFADRVAALTSVEHDKEWYDRVSARLLERGLDNVEYILAPIDRPAEQGGQSAYARNSLAFPEESIDFVLIDGHYRDHSTRFILPKIRHGGMVIIDNVNWFLPSASRAPNSRSLTSGPDGAVWAEVADELSRWRSIWTSSGVCDTAIFIRP